MEREARALEEVSSFLLLLLKPYHFHSMPAFNITNKFFYLCLFDFV